MDDLINDKITDVESSLRKNKNNVRNIWNSFLSFITTTVDMFSKMKFLEGLKCIILMLILCLILNIGGIIVCNTAAGIISNIFSFLKPEHVTIIKDILKSIFHLVWFIGSAIAIIHAFKIKYLNKYEKTNEVKKEIITSNNTKEKTTKVEVNENDKPFEFLEVLAKIVIGFIKFIAAWIALGTIFSTLGLVIAFVVVLTYITTNILFLWISLLLLAAIVASILIVILIIKFIFNKKVNVVLRKSYGAAYLYMNSKQMGADLSYALPTAVITATTPEVALNMLYADEIKKYDDPKAGRIEIMNKYKDEVASPYEAAKRGYIDDVVDPEYLRPVLVSAFDVLLTKREDIIDKKHGNMPL